MDLQDCTSELWWFPAKFLQTVLACKFDINPIGHFKMKPFLTDMKKDVTLFNDHCWASRLGVWHGKNTLISETLKM